MDCAIQEGFQTAGSYIQKEAEVEPRERLASVFAFMFVLSLANTLSHVKPANTLADGYAKVLVQCLNGEGFSLGTAVVLCSVTHVPSPYQENESSRQFPYARPDSPHRVPQAGQGTVVQLAKPHYRATGGVGTLSALMPVGF